MFARAAVDVHAIQQGPRRTAVGARASTVAGVSRGGPTVAVSVTKAVDVDMARGHLGLIQQIDQVADPKVLHRRHAHVEEAEPALGGDGPAAVALE